MPVDLVRLRALYDHRQTYTTDWKAFPNGNHATWVDQWLTACPSVLAELESLRAERTAERCAEIDGECAGNCDSALRQLVAMTAERDDIKAERDQLQHEWAEAIAERDALQAQLAEANENWHTCREEVWQVDAMRKERDSLDIQLAALATREPTDVELLAFENCDTSIEAWNGMRSVLLADAPAPAPAPTTEVRKCRGCDTNLIIGRLEADGVCIDCKSVVKKLSQPPPAARRVILGDEEKP